MAKIKRASSGRKVVYRKAASSKSARHIERSAKRFASAMKALAKR
jgi:hypothetical protein